MRKLLHILILSLVMGQLSSQTGDRIWLNVVYIGNSITQGVQIDNPRRNAPPVKASTYLRKQPNVGEVKYSNRGVSGMTTVDFLPETNTHFAKVVEAADLLYQDTWAQLVFSIMLGTNDSAIKGPNGSPISPKDYNRNMLTIMDDLMQRYPTAIFILHRPIWYSTNTHNGSLYLEEGLNRLNSYLPQLEKITEHYAQSHPGKVFMGDTKGYDLFMEKHKDYLIPEDGNSGIFYLHPNEKGAEILGNLWGEAIYRIIVSQRDKK